MTLSKPKSRKSVLMFLVGGVDIAGLAKLVDAGLSRGLFHCNFELSLTHGQV